MDTMLHEHVVLLEQQKKLAERLYANARSELSKCLANTPALGYLHRAEAENAYTADARNLLAGVQEGAGRAVRLFLRAEAAIEVVRAPILLHPRRAVDVGSLPLRPPALVASGAANVDAAWAVYMEKVAGYRQRRAAALAAWHSESKHDPLAKHGLYPPELTWGGIEYWERVAGTAEGQCASLVVLKDHAVRVPPSRVPTSRA